MLLITTKAKMIELHPEWGIEGIAKAYELLSEFQTVFNARYEYFERDDDTARKLWNNEFHTRWMNLVRENTERTCKWKYEAFENGNLVGARYYHGKTYGQMIPVFFKHMDGAVNNLRARGWKLNTPEMEIKIRQDVTGVVAYLTLVLSKGDEKVAIEHRASGIK